MKHVFLSGCCFLTIVSGWLFPRMSHACSGLDLPIQHYMWPKGEVYGQPVFFAEMLMPRETEIGLRDYRLLNEEGDEIQLAGWEQNANHIKTNSTYDIGKRYTFSPYRTLQPGTYTLVFFKGEELGKRLHESIFETRISFTIRKDEDSIHESIMPPSFLWNAARYRGDKTVWHPGTCSTQHDAPTFFFHVRADRSKAIQGYYTVQVFEELEDTEPMMEETSFISDSFGSGWILYPKTFAKCVLVSFHDIYGRTRKTKRCTPDHCIQASWEQERPKVSDEEPSCRYWGPDFDKRRWRRPVVESPKVDIMEPTPVSERDMDTQEEAQDEKDGPEPLLQTSSPECACKTPHSPGFPSSFMLLCLFLVCTVCGVRAKRQSLISS